MRIFSSSLAVVLVAVGAAAFAAPPSGEVKPSNRPTVLLAWDNTGDFGPATPGTRTAGWQEALDHCVKTAADLYVKGGYGGRQAIYHIDDTIRFPPAQDFRVDGGIYVINFRGPDPTKDAVLIDSAMNCEYHFGLIVYGGSGAGLRIKPQRNVPVDGFPVVIETVIHSQGIADPKPFVPGKRDAGTGLILDASVATISYAKFYFASILNFNTNIRIVGDRGFFTNEFVCEHLHTNSHSGRLIHIGPHASQNIFRFGIGVDQGATGVRGIDLAGIHNVLNISTRPGGFAKAAQITLLPQARGNRINLRTAEDPLSLITDQAATPTNQLTWTGPPLPIQTIQGTPGSFTYTQRLVPATVSIIKGKPTRATFHRGNDRIEYADPKNREFHLSVSDRLTIESPDSPTLRIIPRKP